MSALKEPVYTHKEAEMAAGIGSYVLPAAPLERDMKSAVDDDGRTDVKSKRKKDKNSNEILKFVELYWYYTRTGCCCWLYFHHISLES
jgi:hypothetical protein